MVLVLKKGQEKGLEQRVEKWIGKGMRKGQGFVRHPCLRKFPKSPKIFPSFTS